MANRFIFAALVFLHTIPFLQAQDHESPRFTQHLSWIKDEHTLRYEVIIEREEEGEYHRIRQEFTQALSIEVSLPPGRYRYGVIPYDLLNRPAHEPAWRAFDVLAALAPELTSFSPVQLYTNQKTEPTVSIFGRNLSPNAEIYLRSPDEGTLLTPQNIFFNGSPASEIRLIFDNGQCTPGTYEIHVINPGGLKTSIAGLNVIEGKQAEQVQLVQEDTAWKNKWVYLGGGLGLGSYTWTEKSDSDSGTSDSNSGTSKIDPLFVPGFTVEFAPLPFLSIEMDLAYGLFAGEGKDALVLPVLVKLGGRIARIELFSDIGYTIGAGFTIGGTFGFKTGPGILFAKFISIPWASTPKGYRFTFPLDSVMMVFVGYKIGLGNKR